MRPQVIAKQEEPRPIQPPSIESLLQAGRNLELLCCQLRRQACVDVDAACVSHCRGHRVHPNARISATDNALIESYKILLIDHKARVADVQEKVERRRKEEEKGRYLLILNDATPSSAVSAAKRVEVLLKKELHTRCQKLETENAIYWKCVEMLELLGISMQRIQSIVVQVDKETERRNERNSHGQI